MNAHKTPEQRSAELRAKKAAEKARELLHTSPVHNGGSKAKAPRKPRKTAKK